MNDITRFANDLARELGDGWTVEDAERPDWREAYLVGPRFKIRVADQGTGRALAHPSLPLAPDGSFTTWYPYNVTRPDAQFSLSRPVASIAKDIKRKVIDALDAMWDGPEGIGTRIAESYDYHRRITESYRRAYAVVGRTPPQHLETDHHHTVGYPSTDGVEIRPYGNEWEIKIRLPIDEAEEFVKQIRAKKG